MMHIMIVNIWFYIRGTVTMRVPRLQIYYFRPQAFFPMYSTCDDMPYIYRSYLIYEKLKC